MLNVQNRATGEAMPSLTRRLFLRGAAVIAPLAALPALPALAASSTDYVDENPALLALEPRIDAATSVYDAATADRSRALAVGLKLWPRAPRAIREDRLSWAHDIERGITGAGYDIADTRETAKVATSDEVRIALSRIKRKRNAAGTRKLLINELDVAIAYEAECKNAREVAGFSAADNAQEDAMKDLDALVRLVRAEPARTIVGVTIKARAFHAWSKVPACRRVIESIENDLASDVAASLLAVLNDQSA